MQVFINGAFADGDTTFVSPLSGGFMYGYGAFETIKVHHKNVIFLKEHYERLQIAIAFLKLEMDYSFKELLDICEKLIYKNSIESGFIKIMCSKGKGGSTDTIAFTGNKTYSHEYESGFKLCIASSRRNEFSQLCKVKSMNYAENIIQRELAAKRGFDEALFINTRGDVCEGCISNVFWVKKGSVFTPSVKCGILPGIARRKTIELCSKLGIDVLEGEFSLDDIKSADEIFITNSLMDIMPVSIFEDRQFNVKELNLANKLMDRYKSCHYA